MGSTSSNWRTGFQRISSRSLQRYRRWRLITKSLITFYRRQHGRHKRFVWIWTLTSSTEILRIESQGRALIVHWLSLSANNALSDLNVFSAPWSYGSTTAFGEAQMYVPEPNSSGPHDQGQSGKLWKNS